MHEAAVMGANAEARLHLTQVFVVLGVIPTLLVLFSHKTTIRPPRLNS